MDLNTPTYFTKVFLVGLATTTLFAGIFHGIGALVIPYTPISAEFPGTIIYGALTISFLLAVLLLILWIGAGVLSLSNHILGVSD